MKNFERLNKSIGTKNSTLTPLFVTRSISAMSVYSGRSNIYSDFCVESYGIPYPVQVSEVLTFGKTSTVSLSCSANGWVWAVFNRKLYIWQYKSNPKEKHNDMMPPRKAIPSQCRILTLPHSDIGHKSELVTVFVSEGHQTASCLACSPTGDVRYWPSIANDGVSLDEQGILDGQEFDHLLTISSKEYILVTTTCHLVKLEIQNANGRQTISHRLLRPPSGFLGGIGRKIFSSIIGLNGSEKENRLIKVCSDITKTSGSITILADKWIQEWELGGAGEVFKFENEEIHQEIREFYLQNGKCRETSDLRLWLLDMQTSQGKWYILAAAINLTSSVKKIDYGLFSFVPNGETIRFVCGYILKSHSDIYNSDISDDIKLKFVINADVAYIYGDSKIVPVQIAKELEEMESIEFKNQGDKILSAKVINSLTLFFTRNHGVVSITPPDFEPNESLHKSSSDDVFSLGMSLKPSTSFSVTYTNLSFLTYDPSEIISSNNDTINQIKSAFIYHLKKNNSACNEIIDTLLKDFCKNQQDDVLDHAIINIVKDLAEDVPAADPRWESFQGEKKHPLGSSSSLQIIQQLRDKNTAYTHFVNFLQFVGIWDRLIAITEHGLLRSSHTVITDVGEKIAATIALKNAHSCCSLIDAAIAKVSTDKQMGPIDNLTSHDVFYTKVIHIQYFLHAIVKLLNESFTYNSLPQTLTLLSEVNGLFLVILNEILVFRSKTSQKQMNLFESIPWTSLTGKYGAYDPIMDLINLNTKNSKLFNSTDSSHKYFLQLAELIDFILNEKQMHLESVKDEEKRKMLQQKFERMRSVLINPFVENSQFEIATKLSEKYLEFQTLLIITDKTSNEKRLAEYNEKFKDNNFTQFAINWHLKQNKQAIIFNRFKHDQEALSKFLGDHPSLAWIQLLKNGDYGSASLILLALAQNERDSITKKKKMLSLAKLAALTVQTGVAAANLCEINDELVLVQHQEQLPISLLQHFGYDTLHPKVLTAHEIIQLYVSDENVKATEEDFRKALELLSFVEFPEENRIKIWSAAIQRDDWINYDAHSPLDTMQNMLFFKLIDICYLLDGELDSFLPPIENFLCSSELKSPDEIGKFKYLLKYGYEHVYEVYASKKNSDLHKQTNLSCPV